MAATRLAESFPVQGFLRWALRAPVWFYRHRLGWLFGRTALLLISKGRKSGLPRQAVLEVARYDKQTGTYFVVAGWGAHSDWYRNIQKTPNVLVQSGNERMPARAEILPLDQAEQELRYYIEHHPLRARAMIRLLMSEPLAKDQAEELIGRLARSIPVVALRPRRPRQR